MKYVVPILLLFSTLTGYAQETAEEVPSMVEMMPEFNGGHEALYKFLGSNVNYPQDAMDQGVEGKVYVEFVVDKDGSITDPIVKRGIGYGCDEEAVRVVMAMPAWKPGMQDGKVVKVKYVLPFNFKLADPAPKKKG